MPIHLRSDLSGKFFQYGESGKKYYFKTEIGKKRAYTKARKQTSAIKISEQKAS